MIDQGDAEIAADRAELIEAMAEEVERTASRCSKHPTQRLWIATGCEECNREEQRAREERRRVRRSKGRRGNANHYLGKRRSF